MQLKNKITQKLHYSIRILCFSKDYGAVAKDCSKGDDNHAISNPSELVCYDFGEVLFVPNQHR